MITSFDVIQRQGEFDNEWQRQYTRVYQAECDAIDDEEPDIYAHPLCPVPNVTRAAWDNLAVCTKVNAVYRPKSRWIWDVNATFASVRDQPYVPGQNPLLDPASVTCDSEISMEDAYIDLDGQPTVNTAGDLVQVKIPVPRITFKIRKNVALVTGWLAQVSGVVNDTPVRLKGVLYPRGTLQLWSVHLGDVEEKNGIEYFVCDLVIKHKEDGWQYSYLNTGYNELRLHPKNRGASFDLVDPKNQKPIMVKERCLDGADGRSGDPVTTPVFLDQQGQRPRVVILSPKTGKYEFVIKDPLELSDIVVIKRRFVKYWDFNNKLPIK